MAKRKRERLGEPRRYTFKLYPTSKQHETLMTQARMMASLWNALLDRCEMLASRSYQRQIWTDADGKKHGGYSHHLPEEAEPLRSTRPLKAGMPSEYAMSYWISDLLAECEEWRTLSTWSPRRVATALDGAFKAFFRRMKELSNPAVYEARAAEFRRKKGRNPTRYELSGYPQWRSVPKANWLPHRFKSGCRLLPDEKKAPRERPNGRKSHDKWRLELKGVEGAIKARGEFPDLPAEWTDADLRCEQGVWWLSIAADFASSRCAGNADLTIRFDLIDDFAVIEGAMIEMPDIQPLLRLEARIDALKSERDRRWPWKPGVKPSCAKRTMSLQIGRLAARKARMRREALHEWTTKIIAQASRITVIAPQIKEATRTAKGNEADWGAATKTVAMLNRHVLAQAPAMTIQMLKYKAEEANVPCLVIEDEYPPVAMGDKLSRSVKTVRRLKRTLTQAERQTAA